jgi:hypothetical protein
MLCQLSYRGTLWRSRIVAIRLFEDGHAGKAAAASDRHRKRCRGRMLCQLSYRGTVLSGREL